MEIPEIFVRQFRGWMIGFREGVPREREEMRIGQVT